MEGSDAPLVGLVDPPRYSPRLRGDTPPAATPSSCSGDVWGRLSQWHRPMARPLRETRDRHFDDEFSSRQLVLSSTNQKRSNPS